MGRNNDSLTRPNKTSNFALFIQQNREVEVYFMHICSVISVTFQVLGYDYSVTQECLPTKSLDWYRRSHFHSLGLFHLSSEFQSSGSLSVIIGIFHLSIFPSWNALVHLSQLLYTLARPELPYSQSPWDVSHFHKGSIWMDQPLYTMSLPVIYQRTFLALHPD